MKKEQEILLIGSNGQLGSEISHLLTKERVPFSQLSYPHFDLSWDDKTLFDFLIDQYPQNKYLILCAAMTNTGECEENSHRSHQINGLSLKAISHYANAARSTLIHFSSDYVFNGKKNGPYEEEDPCFPLNVYGRSKLLGELIIQDLCDRHFILRISSLYGVFGRNFVETMLNKAQNELEVIKVVDDQIISPTHTLDVAKAVYQIIQSHNQDYGIYHLSNSGQCSWYQFTQKIFSLSGNSDKVIHPVKTADFPSRLKRPQYSVLSSKKIAKKIYQPLTWEEGLKNYFTQRKEIQ